MGGSSLAELNGLAWIVRVSCTVVVGVGALVGTQSIFVSEFPPSVRLTPATFPQGGRLLVFAHAFLDAPRGTAFSGPCFAVAGFLGIQRSHFWHKIRALSLKSALIECLTSLL